MFVLGVVLIVLAVLFGLGVSVSSTASTKLEVFGVDFGVSVPTVFFLGVAAGAILMLGLWLTKKGLGRGYRRRKEMRELRAQATTTPDTAPAATTTPTPVGGEITESDTKADLRPSVESRSDGPADERLAVEQELTPDPNDTKQPH
ncbi:hypothetical protein AB0L70_08410 [Kribbella sp. NPDC051952]|uniref:hypothetical protein n=1 Tax=Kribbella sp. NPDC051952 TaxID=3154851 RepID=UPI0034156390